MVVILGDLCHIHEFQVKVFFTILAGSKAAGLKDRGTTGAGAGWFAAWRAALARRLSPTCSDC